VRLRDKLNGLQLSTLSEPGIYADGGGLYLRVRSKAARSWYYISKVNGVRREMGLGSAFDVSLAGARKKAAIARAAFLEGRDPIQERKVEAAPVVKTVRFGAFAESLIDDIQDGFRNEKHRKQWRATLKTHAKALSTKDVASITDIEDLLDEAADHVLLAAHRPEQAGERDVDADQGRSQEGDVAAQQPEPAVDVADEGLQEPIDDVEVVHKEILEMKPRGPIWGAQPNPAAAAAKRRIRR